MDFWIPICAIALFIISYPYLRCFYKRLKLVRKLKGLCRRKNFKLHAVHPFWMFGGKHGGACDFYIETEREILSLKLFGAKNNNRKLCFTSDGEYYFIKYIALVSKLGGTLSMPLETKRHTLTAYDFRRGFRDEWEIKIPKNVLLLHPVCHEILYVREHGKTEIIGAGDNVGGAEIYSLSRLLGYLEVTE